MTSGNTTSPRVRRAEGMERKSAPEVSQSVPEKVGPIPQCKTCRFPDHEKYDAECIKGNLSRGDYAKMVGCTAKSISRHLAHIPQIVANSANAEIVTNADNLLDQIVYYEAEARRFKELAESQGDLELALKSVDRALKCLDLFARVRGIIQEQPQVNILVNPQWIELKAVIVAALRPYPDALEAVRDALR
jgi:hypothetical protein